jgi:hypothetical protein
MKDYKCQGCGKTVTFMIENLCHECFEKEPDYEDILEQRREREDEYRIRRGEGDTINFVKREVRG